MDKTINDVFARQTHRYGDRVAIEKKANGQWHHATWNQYYERARNTGLGLAIWGFARATGFHCYRKIAWSGCIPIWGPWASAPSWLRFIPP